MISVALTTYNGEKYIVKQLESIEKQTLKPDEVVLCDDNSDDNTFKLLKEFKSKSSLNLILIKNSKTLGFVKNFEKAISLCSGEVIFLSDQDDIWKKNKIISHINLYKSNREINYIINDAIYFGEKIKHKGKSKISRVKILSNINKNYIMGCCSSFKSKYIEILFPIPDYIISHDKWISDFFLLSGGKKILKKKLQFYRIHSNNNSTYKLNKSILLNSYTKPKSSLINEINLDIESIEIYINRLKKLNNKKISLSIENFLNFKNSLKFRLKLLGINNYIKKIFFLYKHFRSINYYNFHNGHYSIIRDLINK